VAFLVGSLPPVPSSVVPSTLPSSADVRRRVDAVAPSLDPGSPQARAAVLLLLAREVGLNVDRLARLSGFDRHFVAACVRRLYDNRVWTDGRTCYAWTEPDEAAFWNDVGVAVGRLCRRTDEEGNPSWAPAGSWTKVYDFVSRAPAHGAAVMFLPARAGEAPVLRAPAVRAASGARPRRSPRRVAARRFRPDVAPELFPGASWLG